VTKATFTRSGGVRSAPESLLPPLLQPARTASRTTTSFDVKRRGFVVILFSFPITEVLVRRAGTQPFAIKQFRVEFPILSVLALASK
jgi:hypothetical protein